MNVRIVPICVLFILLLTAACNQTSTQEAASLSELADEPSVHLGVAEETEEAQIDRFVQLIVEPDPAESPPPVDRLFSSESVESDSTLLRVLGLRGDTATEGIDGLGMRGVGRGGGGVGEGFGGIGGLGMSGRAGRGSGTVMGNRAGPYGRFQEPQRNREGYGDYGINPWVDATTERMSTFGVDVDTGSYTLSRRKLNDGGLPVADGVRVEEFLNYFRYTYPEPVDGPIGVHLEAAPRPFADDPNHFFLRVGLQARSLAGHERKPVHLTFLVDVSGSMNRPNRLPLAKRTLEILTNNLRPGDTVALVTYAGRVEKILEPTGVEYKGRIIEAIESLHAAGSTAMGSGIDLAYEMASNNFVTGHVNRVIVLSDGDANVGGTGHAEILKQVEHQVKKGITLSTVGFGVGNYQDVMMEQLANRGNGNYSYVDRLEEAHRIFGDNLGGTLEVVAKDVKIQVEFNPDVVARYRLVGYENRHIENKDFRNDAVDAGEMGVGHTVTALFEVELIGEADVADVATVRMRHKEPDGHEAAEAAFSLSLSQIRQNFDAASQDFAFIVAAAAFAELLRESPHTQGVSIAELEALATRAAGSHADRRELVELLRKAKPMLLARHDAVR